MEHYRIHYACCQQGANCTDAKLCYWTIFHFFFIQMRPGPTHPLPIFLGFLDFLTLQSPLTNLPCLKERQDSLCKKYFQNIMETTRRLNYLFPCQRCNKYDVRRFNKYPLPEIRTNRYLNSLIPWGLYHWQ